MTTIVTIDMGGTGATHAAGAREALSVPSMTDMGQSYAQANSARDQANTARGNANDAYSQANTAYSQANSARGQANTAYGQANSARSDANTTFATINTTFGTVNTNYQAAYAQANNARDQANTARTQANTGYDQANTARTQANTAYGQANSAYGQANAAYGAANTKLASAGGTVSGDLIITGNLTVSGNQTILNTEVLTTEDAEIILLSNTAGTPALNAGLIVNRGTSTNTFLRWNEAVDEWGWSDSGTTTYYFEDLRSGLVTTNTTFGTVNTTFATLNTSAGTQNTAITNAHDQANSARGQANTAYGQANAAYSQANAAYGQANTARSDANTTFATVNTTFGTINTSLGTINTSYQAAYAQANTARTTANDAYGQANTARNTANSAYGQANTATTNAGNAYDTANNAYTASSRLRADDLRTIAPNSHTAGRLTFGFTSYTNNGNASSYADYLHFRSYTDSSGGSDNLVMFHKSGIGMRIWQHTWNSSTAYSNYVDVLHSSNYSSYAVPLSGGTMTGQLNISAGGLLVTGNVGIGTTSPQGRLSVDGGNFRFNYGNDAAQYIYINAATGADGGILFTRNNTLRWQFNLGNAANNISLYSYGTASQVFNVEYATGNVGIGTTSPINKLQVVGTIGVSETTSGQRGRLFWTTSGFTGIGLYNDDNSSLVFGTNGTARVEVDVSGHMQPYADNSYNLGSASKRWANIYTADLNLSNRDSQNDVDGTWGEWTIQEGENDLYLINRRNDKKFKFMLKEVE